MSGIDYDALAEAGYERVVIEYSGHNDEGWINEITPDPEDLGDKLSSLYDRIEQWAYDLLEDLYGGWEINEGSSGTITIHVAERKASVNHGWVVESTQQDNKEVYG